MSQFLSLNLAGKLWQLVKGALMLTGAAALVAWQVDASGQRSRLPGPVAHTDTPPALVAVEPERIAGETLALADEAGGATPAAAAEHKRVAGFLARKYRVAADATRWIVSAAYSAGKEVGVDPLLVLAVMAVESRMNPYAESGMGAQGLMQVIPKYHLDKFEDMGGRNAVLNPIANIRVGTLILKDYLRRFGDVEAGLRAYSGATGDDMGYANKVLAERDRLKAAAGTTTGSVVKAVPTRAEPKPLRTAQADPV